MTEYAKKEIERIMQESAPNRNPTKPEKKMNTDLSIKPEPLIEVDNGQKVKLSKLPDNHKLFSTRSISLQERSLEKLKFLCIKLDMIDYYSGRDRLFELVTIPDEPPEEATQEKHKDQHVKSSRHNSYPPSPGQSRPRRSHGRNRYR
ncbi:hypothetical protein LIER_30483 [Lithospermum erythrorhizon]|uniref:Uncharacterized protein n=1 Tax=Lithospermum erythrorhizon TaxID=34254 RepID=A0AAV3RR31_LITER